jgi:hypothetical protein
MSTEETSQSVPERHRYGWPSILVAAIFGVIYADVLWNAIGDLVNLPALFGTLTPWWLLILDIVVPVAAFVAAFFLGRRRSLGARAMFFLIGLGVLACSTVASIGYIQTHFGIV